MALPVERKTFNNYSDWTHAAFIDIIPLKDEIDTWLADLQKQTCAAWRLIVPQELYSSKQTLDPRITTEISSSLIWHPIAGERLFSPRSLEFIREARLTYRQGEIFYFDEASYLSPEDPSYTTRTAEGKTCYVRRLAELHLSSIDDPAEILPRSMIFSKSVYPALRVPEIKDEDGKTVMPLAWEDYFFDSLLKQQLVYIHSPITVTEAPTELSQSYDRWKFLVDKCRPTLEQILAQPPEEGKNWYRVAYHPPTLIQPDLRYSFRHPQLISVLVPTFKRGPDLFKAVDSILLQDDPNFEICIVGDACPLLESLTPELLAKSEKIKISNLPQNSKDEGSTPRNYALKRMVSGDLIANLDDDNTWDQGHLSSLRKALHSRPEVAFAFSSFWFGEYRIISKQPRRCRIDTSTLLSRYSLFKKYGFWSKDFPTDWSLVERWLAGQERWAATLLPTLRYVVDPKRHNAKGIYEAYDDQED